MFFLALILVKNFNCLSFLLPLFDIYYGYSNRFLRKLNIEIVSIEFKVVLICMAPLLVSSFLPFFYNYFLCFSLKLFFLLWLLVFVPIIRCLKVQCRKTMFLIKEPKKKKKKARHQQLNYSQIFQLRWFDITSSITQPLMLFCL